MAKKQIKSATPSDSFFFGHILWTKEELKFAAKQDTLSSLSMPKKDALFPGTIKTPRLLTGECNPRLGGFFGVDYRLEKARAILREQKNMLTEEELLRGISIIKSLLCTQWAEDFPEHNPYETIHVSDLFLFRLQLYKQRPEATIPMARFSLAMFAIGKFAQFVKLQSSGNTLAYSHWSAIDNKFFSPPKKPKHLSSGGLYALLGGSSPMFLAPKPYQEIAPLLDGIGALEEIDSIDRDGLKKAKARSAAMLGEHKEKQRVNARNAAKARREKDRAFKEEVIKLYRSKNYKSKRDASFKIWEKLKDTEACCLQESFGRQTIERWLQKDKGNVSDDTSK